jgi:hypothetical protein
MVVEEDNAHYTPFAILLALSVQAIEPPSVDNEAPKTYQLHLSNSQKQHCLEQSPTFETRHTKLETPNIGMVKRNTHSTLGSLQSAWKLYNGPTLHWLITSPPDWKRSMNHIVI